ncbi:PKD domain-containing protein [Halobacterium zhouii]|uniref:PKD domain-containing protein n=1 Tax=Halobacterium zhouii TaxID=2902624 RepID=UPI001E304705|nr:PKD domain-containing protein [Halobacterium zhouii]
MSRRVAIVVVIGLVLAPLAATGAAATPPSPPAAYYGDVTVNGESAPAGVTVEAVVDGEVRASLTTSEGGALGGAGAFDEKLVVEGTAGENVTFRVGDHAVKTVAWESGAHEQVSLSVTDGAAPTPAVSAPDSVPAGTTVRFDATGSTDDVGVVDYEWTLPDGTTVAGTTADVTFEQAGEYTVSIAVTDAAGNTETTAASITVTDAGNGGSNAGDSDPGGSDDSSPADDTSEHAPDVVVGENAVNVAFTELPADTPATAVFANTAATSANGVSLNELTLSTTRETNVTLDVSASESVPAGTPAVGSGSLLYLNVSESVSEDALGEVTFGFTVSEKRLAAANADPSEVSLWRYHDGEWAQLDTQVAGQTGDAYRFNATSPGLSVFAVRAASADVSVESADLGDSSVTVGDSVAVSATLVNDGAANGSATVPFVVDGETITERTVMVPANGERTVSVTYTPGSEGTYDVRVGNVSAGTLDVTAAGTTDAPDDQSTTAAPDNQDQPDGPPTGPTREPSGFSATSVAAVGLIVAAVLGLFLLARRRA